LKGIFGRTDATGRFKSNPITGEYLKPVRKGVLEVAAELPAATDRPLQTTSEFPLLDRTAKFYIEGKQVRPDNGNSLTVLAADGTSAGLVGEGSRKDIRNAVEAAVKAESWARATAHNRAQIIYFIAENLGYRTSEFCQRLVTLTGLTQRRARKEVDKTIERLFYYAAWADKYDGVVHQPPIRGVTLAMNEPIGIVGIGCPDGAPLLSFISMLAPIIAMGNRAVVIPSQAYPLVVSDFYQVLETSDVPAGVVNIVTGDRDSLIKVLADHSQVDGLWYHGTEQGSQMAETASAGNLKRNWVNHGYARDWYSAVEGQGKEFLLHSCQVKNIWIPYGDAV